MGGLKSNVARLKVGKTASVVKHSRKARMRREPWHADAQWEAARNGAEAQRARRGIRAPACGMAGLGNTHSIQSVIFSCP
jgi:hypothetical protein